MCPSHNYLLEHLAWSYHQPHPLYKAQVAFATVDKLTSDPRRYSRLSTVGSLATYVRSSVTVHGPGFALPNQPQLLSNMACTPNEAHIATCNSFPDPAQLFGEKSLDKLITGGYTEIEAGQ